MKKLIYFALILFCPVFLIAQEEEDNSYVMFETMYITPDYTKLAAFSDAMSNHNNTYHKEGAYTAQVYNISTGPNVGKIVWVMGPCTYTDLDSRPSEGGHDEDWANNVMPLVKKMTHGEYWEMDTELSTVAPGSGPYSVARIRFHEVNQGEGHRIQGVLKRISDTVKSMEGDNPWAVFYNQWQQGSKIGRHIATVSYHNSWSELDDDTSFRKAYEALHGANSWDGFIREINGTFSNSWDEFWSYSTAMSASAND